jgi:hypothetical protein
LAVLRINGTNQTAGTAQSGTLFEIRDNGATATVVQSFTLATPTANNTTPGVTFSNSATTDGFLHRSTDGQSISLVGYSATVGTTSVTGTPSATASRVIADISASAAVTYNRFTDTTYSGSNARAAVSVGGNKFYTAGDASAPANRGVRYADFTVGPTSARLQDANVRDVNVFGSGGNQRLFSATASVVSIIGPGGPPPTTGTPTVTALTGLGGITNIRGFVLLDRDATRSFDGSGLDTLYLVNSNLVRKYELDATDANWVLNGTYDPGVASGNLFGLSARINGGSVDLFVTEEANGGNLIKVTDTAGYGSVMNATDIWSVGATDFGANYALRGLDFTPVPIPEPATVLGAAVAGLGLVRVVRGHRKRPR